MYLSQKIDLVVAAKTGQGKTLVFGLPILDSLIKKLTKMEMRGEEPILDSVKALIISPTRELAIQIKDMINAVIPMDY